MPKTSDYRQIVNDHVFDEALFVEAVFKAKGVAETISWKRVTVRPVAIRGDRHLQFSYFDSRQTAVRNYRGQEAVEALNDLLAARLKSIQVRTATETLQVQFSRKGRPILHYHALPQTIPLDLTHDRSKHRLLPDNEPLPFLQAIGVQTADGRVRADKQRKFRQINEFLRLMDETGVAQQLDQWPLHVVDLGCGSAALTFATYYYLNHLAGVPAQVIGVDVKQQLVEQRAYTAHKLDWEKMSFVSGTILSYRPERPPDIVLALHACDTAIDEALAQAIGWESKLIFSAPCCHHHLQVQLGKNPVPQPFRPVVRYGILHERLGDILTDAFRALILRIMGYQTEVLEFVDPESTPRNLMIRAVRKHPAGSRSHLKEYDDLKRFWNVTPYLETLLENSFYALRRDSR
jgi:SAM-dependent methyltransferase